MPSLMHRSWRWLPGDLLLLLAAVGAGWGIVEAVRWLGERP